jgi:hypothetical protein
MATVNRSGKSVVNAICSIRDVPRGELLGAYAMWKMGADVVELAKALDVSDWSLEKSFEFRKRMESIGALEGLELNLPGTRKSTP